MRIGFAGLGKLGFPIALAIESKGHSVVAYDPSDAPRRMLASRRLEYREAGADELLARSAIELASMEEMVERSEMIFVTIQTPHEPRFEGVTRVPADTADFDYRYLAAGVAHLSTAVEAIGRDRTIVIVSTVLPGTIRREIKPLLGPHSRLCYNPFFIAMGGAIRDFLNPEFVLFGVDDNASAAEAERFYRTDPRGSLPANHARGGGGDQGPLQHVHLDQACVRQHGDGAMSPPPRGGRRRGDGRAR